MNTTSNNDVEKDLAAYLDKVDQLLAALPRRERDEVRQEIRAHIDDAMMDADASSDSQRLQQAIQRLGDPIDFVPELAEELRLSRKAGRGHPAAILMAFSARMGRGLLDTLLIACLGLGYLFTLGLICIAVYSLFEPQAGLWLNQGGGWTLSFEQQSNADQAFAGWFWLVGGVAGVSLYAVLTGLLRWWLKRSVSSALKNR
ncbi:MAG: hypothetical protein DHS20C11_15690 [Lysobacteraceae bacterium]|nr:MAG: hypothetical protein DHS20C11_15690 [Xanthomonadaceae bacterium]